MLVAAAVLAWLAAVPAPCLGAPVYSSFYAPLADPRVLGYRVDARFDPESAARARAAYRARYGYRGEGLVRELGEGRRPPPALADYKVYGDVMFQYTYPGASSYHPRLK